MHPFFSIIIPFFNSGPFLSRCVESVLSQTFSNFELLLIDDGSLDNGGEIADSYARKDERVKVIHRSHSGVSATRQCGLESAQGEYVYFCDSDDWVEPCMLEVLYGKAKSGTYDMIIFDHWMDKGTMRRRYRQYFKEVDCKERNSLLYLFISNVLWNKMLKRTFYEEKGIKFPESINYAEDVLVIYEILSYPLHLVYVPYALYHYDKGMNTDSLTSKAYTKDSINSLKYVIDYLENKYNDKLLRLKLQKEKSIVLVGMYRNKSLSYKDLKDLYPEARLCLLLDGLKHPLLKKDYLMLAFRLLLPFL